MLGSFLHSAGAVVAANHRNCSLLPAWTTIFVASHSYARAKAPNVTYKGRKVMVKGPRSGRGDEAAGDSSFTEDMSTSFELLPFIFDPALNVGPGGRPLFSITESFDPLTCQTLLFSATLSSALADFAKAGLHEPQLVRLDVETRISPDLKLNFFFFTLRNEEKVAVLLYLVREVISSDQQILIFVSTKHHVEFLNSLFREEGIEPSISHVDMDQDARKIHISKFRSGSSCSSRKEWYCLFLCNIRGYALPIRPPSLSFKTSQSCADGG